MQGIIHNTIKFGQRTKLFNLEYQPDTEADLPTRHFEMHRFGAE